MAVLSAPAPTGRLLGQLTKADANFATALTTDVDVTGLTGLTVTCPATVIVEFTGGKQYNTVAAKISQAKIKMDDADIATQGGYVSTAANEAVPCVIRARVTGLTPGSSHVFKVTLSRTAFSDAGNATLECGATNQAVLTVREG